MKATESHEHIFSSDIVQELVCSHSMWKISKAMPTSIYQNDNLHFAGNRKKK